MADRRPRRAVDAGVKLHIVDVDEKHGLRNRIAALEEQNTNLQRENEKRNENENWLQREVNRLECELRQAQSDRDNWRKQALAENSRLEEILQRLRRFLDASEEEERRSKSHMDAFNEKQMAFKELTDFALIPKEVVAK